MIATLILIFVIGYSAIVFEHKLHLDKTVPALIMGALMWAVLAISFHFGWLNIIDYHDSVISLKGVVDPVQHETINEIFTNTLLHHIGKISEILIFLIGAMTIVELIDLHHGFDVIKSYIKTRNKKHLLWIIGIVAFILSSIIDNLTTTIVLISILRKLIEDRKLRMWYVSLIVIAANAGGAWSPIGDVTTTMLWIGKKVSAVGLMEYLVLPSVLCFIFPFFVASRMKQFNGMLEKSVVKDDSSAKYLSSKTMLFAGLGAIVFVPVFKTITHLPPYIGMMLSLGIVWLISEYIHPEEDFTEDKKASYSPHKALSRIELSSILFFLGILLAISAFETAEINSVGILRYAAEGLDQLFPDRNVVVILLGICSAIIDNVPLVAASIGMYDIPLDHHTWHFIAYAAGTGGSMLIIGSAAGVAAMGMEKIDFIWYFKNISWLAALGYLVGAASFIFLFT